MSAPPLAENEIARALSWLPSTFPPNIRVVVTSSPHEVVYQLVEVRNWCVF